MSKFAFPGVILKGDMSWNLPVWFFYLTAMIRQMGMPMLVISIISFIFYLFKKDRFNWTLFAWAILPIVVFTFVDNKGARYTMSTLPAMALITAVVLTQVKTIALRKFLYSVTGITALGTAVFAGFIPGHIPQLSLGDKNIPITQSWPINPILDDIIEIGRAHV